LRIESGFGGWDWNDSWIEIDDVARSRGLESGIGLVEFQIPLFILFFLNISEVVDFQIPLLDVAVTWRKSGSVEAENRVGRE
jgi:hypothetical protein